MNEGMDKAFSKVECAEWLKKIGQSASGTVEELRAKIDKFSVYPNLVRRLQQKAQANYKFQCSLDPLSIPPIRANWCTSEDFFPVVNEDIFNSYCSLKKQASIGQQEKAVRMLQSRKIVSVKTLNCSEGIYVKGMIKKSYGNQIRPAVILFNGLKPEKAHCSCPVGSCGLCCHVLSLMLFFKHFHDTGEKILELTCTEQLQKWHRRSKKGSIPMTSLKDIKVKSAKLKKKNGKICITPADPNTSLSKRNVTAMIQKLKEKLKEEKPVETHIYNVLMNSNIGRKSSVGEHLNYKYNLQVAMSLADHDYCKTKLFDINVISIDQEKINKIHQYINQPSTRLNSNKENKTNYVNDIIKQNYLPLVLEKSCTIYQNVRIDSKELHSEINNQIVSGESIIKIDISFLHAPKPYGTNYIHLDQNSENWNTYRKFKITASRLPALLGFYGKTKYNSVWDVVKNGAVEPDISYIKNIERGHLFEQEAINRSGL